MLSFFRIGLQMKLLLIAFFSALLVFSVVAVSFYQYNNITNQVIALSKEESANKKTVLILLTTFKTQVQEWKNVLIRGHDNKERTLHWSKFLELSNEINDSSNKLLKSTEDNPEIQRSLMAFIHSYNSTNKQYTVGFNAFIESDYNIHFADKIVKGIDRAPTMLLECIVHKIMNTSENKTNKLINDRKRMSVYYLMIIVIVISIGILFYFYYTRKLIIAPVEKLSKALVAMTAICHKFNGNDPLVNKYTEK